MSVAVDAVASATGFASATSPLSWTHTAGTGGSAVLVQFNLEFSNSFGSVTPGTVTYGGNTMTKLGSQESGGSGHGGGGTYLYGIAGQASGANTVSVPLATGAATIIGNSISFTGAASTVGAAFGTPVTANSTSLVTTGSITVTGTTSGNVVCGVACDGSGFTSTTAGTQQWLLNHDMTYAAGSIWCATIAAGGSVTVSWTQSAANWGAVAVEVLAGSANISASFGLAMAPLKESFTATETISASFGLAMAPLKESFTATETGANISASFGLAMAPLKMLFRQPPSGHAMADDDRPRLKRWRRRRFRL